MNRIVQQILALPVVVLASITAQAQVSTGLLANLARTVSIQVGAPLSLQVTVADFDAQGQHSENVARRAELRMLDQDLKEGRITPEHYQNRISRLDTIPVAITRLGSPTEPWYSGLLWSIQRNDGATVAAWERHLMRMPPADSVVVLDGVTTATASFGIDPETTQGIAPGTYRIRVALLPGVLSPAANDTIWSEPVSVEFMPPSKQAKTFQDRLVLADYFRRRGRDGDALALAEALLAERADQLNALAIKGDALAGLGRIDEAIATFEKALAVFETTYGDIEEPPMYLMHRIDELLARQPSQQLQR